MKMNATPPQFEVATTLAVLNEDDILRSYLYLCDYHKGVQVTHSDERRNVSCSKNDTENIVNYCWNVRLMGKQRVLDVSDYLGRLVHMLRHSAQPVATLQEEVCLEVESNVTALRQQLLSLQSTLTHECSLMDQILQTRVWNPTDIRNCKTLWIKTLHTRLYNHIQRWELRVTLNILQYIDTKLYSSIFVENAEYINYHSPTDANRHSNNISIVKQNLEQFRSALLNVKRRIMIDPILLRHVADNILLSSGTSRNPDFSSSPGLPRSRLDSSNLQSQEQTLKQQNNSLLYSVDQCCLDISCAKSLLEAINIFCSQDRTRRHKALVYTSLLIAPSGYGKTYTCNQIEKEFGQVGSEMTKDVIVLRPRLPVDLLDENVGQSEDTLVSLFNCALNMDIDKKILRNHDGLSKMSVTSFRKRSKVIIVLDNLEYIVGNDLMTGKNDTSSARNLPYNDVIARTRSCFFTLLDWMREQQRKTTPFDCNDIFFVATSTDAIQGVRDRFDSIFHLALPSELERTNIIESFFLLEKKSTTTTETPPTSFKDQALELEYKELLSKLSNQLVGKPVGTIAKYCRETFLTSSIVTRSVSKSSRPLDEEDDDNHTLIRNALLCMQQMDKMLQITTPESVRSGTLDVSISVESSQDLLGSSRDHAMASQPPALSLFGMKAAKAWEELESLIIPPLCRPDKLEDLLLGAYTTNSSSRRTRSRRILCAGALLSGPPGCGLSTLARHCASVAASIVPSMKLLTVSCTSLIHKEVGRSERSVQQLFTAARHAAPCIVVLDGIETISRVRGNDNTTHGTMDRILSTLLTEMDGIPSITTECSSEDKQWGRIAVIGITHHASWIDPALRRPNRLDKCITLDYPDVEARERIASGQLYNLPLDFSHASYFEPKCIGELSHWVALHTSGMSATDVIALCTEAVMACLREAMNPSNDEARTSTGAIGQESKARLRHTHFVSALKFRTTGKI